MKTKKADLNLQRSSEAKVSNEFPIVGIGASAGGLDPIRKLLENLPVDTGMAFVIIQHLAPGQESLLPEILSRSTKMKVLQVADGMKAEQDHVYVIIPGKTMTLKDGKLRLVPKGLALKPINDFMISIASELKSKAIGVVLSGTGNDGTEGLKAIKAEGGITFTQDPNTAQYPDMPKNAIALEIPDFVLSPEQIAKELVRIAKYPKLIRSETRAPEPENVETDLKKIVMMVKTSFGVDFTHYKENTLDRRITRRMVINKIQDIMAYVEYLRAHPSELQALFDDLLIGVTSFFREPGTFLALKEKVFPELVKTRSSNESIRVWIPGCSTGEEVYSFAISIQEFLEEKALPNIRVQLFGTDANEKNIEKARRGTYPKSIEDNVSEMRLKRFFTANDGDYRITKSIRDMCIFAKHDITTDPPFSNIDLIMCRNVFIYFDSYLHEQVLSIFNYGLKPNGFLVLGESESIGNFKFLFEPITSKGLIYRRKQAHPQVMLGENAFVPYSGKKTATQIGKTDQLTILGEKVDHLITSEYGPGTLLVNNKLDILVFRGDVAPYLSPDSGAASFNVTKIIRKELRSQVQTALYRAKKEKKAIKENVSFKQKGQPKTINIEIRALETTEYDEPFYLVLFTEAISHDMISTKEAESGVLPGEVENLKDRQIRELKEDLEANKQSLQTLVEGQQAINEELQSSMEEVQSSNEELQSTNEELETAKEELQSGNEELQTLNEELKNRNKALGLLNDDLANLQMNIDLPVVIVDNEFKIRRFTASAQKLLKISPSDIGRSIIDLNLGVHAVDLGKIISDVTTKLTAVIQEVECAEDRLCEMRVRPYLTEEKKIDGAVVSFTDITELKKAEEASRKSEQEYSSLFANMIDGFAYCEMMFDETGKPVDFIYLQINDAFESITGLKRKLIIGKKVTEAIPGIKKANPELFEIYGRVALTGKKEKFEVFFKPLSMWLSISVYCPRKNYFAAVFEDITERKKAEETLEKTNEELEERVRKRTEEVSSERQRLYSILEALPAYVILLDKDYRVPFANKVFRERFGESNGRRCFDFLFKRDSSCENCETYKALKNNKPHRWEWTGPDGRNYDIYDFPFVESDGSTLILEMGIDITDRKKAEAMAQESARKLKDSERLAAIGATAGMVGHDIRNPLQAITSEIYLAKTDLASAPDSEEKKNTLESLQEIQKNVDYINKIVADLQDFAKPIRPVPKEIDLPKLVEEVLAKNGIPKNVKVQVKMQKNLDMVMVDSDILKRVLDNLVINAVQAMPEGGRLSIEACNNEKDSVITVEDTGVGISEEAKDKLFTPLFTTKAKGQGFGLAVVKRLTESLGGTITFESEVGKGTKFSIHLPNPQRNTRDATFYVPS